MYIVMSIKHRATVMTIGFLHKIPTLVEMKFADGMVGVLPVFGTLKDAEKFADGKAEILEIGEVSDDEV